MAQGPGGRKEDVVRKRVPFRAQARGQQFVVTLIAMKNGHGLFEVPIALGQGELLVMRPMGPEAGGFSTVQLFAKMERAHHEGGFYILGWERVICPEGSVELMEFLQRWLGVCLTNNTLPGDPIVGEMVTFDFRNQVLSSPKRGKLSTSVERIGSAVLAAPRTLPSEAPTPPLTGRPVAPRPRPEPAPVRQKNIASFNIPDEDEDGPVEMFGMKISKNDWERLDNIGMVQTDPRTKQPTRVKSAPSSPRPANGNGEQTAEQKPSRLGGLLRKLAEKLTE